MRRAIAARAVVGALVLAMRQLCAGARQRRAFRAVQSGEPQARAEPANPLHRNREGGVVIEAGH